MSTIVDSAYEVHLATASEDLDRNEITRLFANLTKNASRITDRRVQIAIQSPANTVVFARECATGKLVGCGTLSVLMLFAKQVGMVNDLIVEPEHQSRGIGGKILDLLIQSASNAGCDAIELTSSPSRYTAQLLYRSRSFIQRETTVLRHTVGQQSQPLDDSNREARDALDRV